MITKATIEEKKITKNSFVFDIRLGLGVVSGMSVYDGSWILLKSSLTYLDDSTVLPVRTRLDFQHKIGLSNESPVSIIGMLFGAQIADSIITGNILLSRTPIFVS